MRLAGGPPNRPSLQHPSASRNTPEDTSSLVPHAFRGTRVEQPRRAGSSPVPVEFLRHWRYDSAPEPLDRSVPLPLPGKEPAGRALRRFVSREGEALV